MPVVRGIQVPGGGSVVVGSVMGAFFLRDPDSVSTPPPLDIVALAGVLWNVELTRDSTLRPQSLTLRLAESSGAPTAGLDNRAVGSKCPRKEPAVEDTGRQEEEASRGGAAVAYLPPATATIFVSGRVIIMTSLTVDAIAAHARRVADAVERALTLVRDPAPHAIGVHRPRVEWIAAYYHVHGGGATPTAVACSSNDSAAAVQPASGQPPSQQPKGIPNSIHTQLVHSRLASLDAAPYDARVDLLSDPHDKAVKAELSLRVQGSNPSRMAVRIEHTGVAAVKRCTNVEDFVYACEHILGPTLRHSRRQKNP
jgi:hypothetical protein